MLETHILLTGLIVFVARICDVSIGTVRTIVTVQGRTVIAFVLAVFEISIWITIVSTVIHQVKDNPVLIAFYAFGYATGNVVGIMVERKIGCLPVVQDDKLLGLITETDILVQYCRELGGCPRPGPETG